MGPHRCPPTLPGHIQGTEVFTVRAEDGVAVPATRSGDGSPCCLLFLGFKMCKKNREFNFKNSNIFKPTLRIQHGDTRKMSKKPRRSPKLPTFIENGYTSWNAKGKWRKKS